MNVSSRTYSSDNLLLTLKMKNSQSTITALQRINLLPALFSDGVNPQSVAVWDRLY